MFNFRYFFGGVEFKLYADIGYYTREYARDAHKVSFPLVPQLVNDLLCEATVCVRDRVMASHDACTSGTYRVLTVAFLQRLRMEAFIPTPADCEMRSVIKFLNAQSIAPIEIHRQLCQVYGHTQVDGQHIFCRRSAARCLVIHLIALTWSPLISIFS